MKSCDLRKSFSSSHLPPLSILLLPIQQHLWWILPKGVASGGLRFFYHPLFFFFFDTSLSYFIQRERETFIYIPLLACCVCISYYTNIYIYIYISVRRRYLSRHSPGDALSIRTFFLFLLVCVVRERERVVFLEKKEEEKTFSPFFFFLFSVLFLLDIIITPSFD